MPPGKKPYLLLPIKRNASTVAFHQQVSGNGNVSFFLCSFYIYLYIFIYLLCWSVSLEAWYVAVGFHRWEENVQEPQESKEGRCKKLGSPWPAQLTANFRPSSVEQDTNAYECKYGEKSDRESQCARWDSKLFSASCMVNGSNGPCYANPQENIHSVATGDITYGGISILILNSCHFACKGICGDKREAFC